MSTQHSDSTVPSTREQHGKKSSKWRKRPHRILARIPGDFWGYAGLPGQIGHDGIWESKKEQETRFYVVVEVKTTETYPINTATLTGYVDALIAQRRVSDWESAVGLYVIGRSDPEVRQLENAIVAERRNRQLRVISADSLLSLAEVVNEYDVSHDDVLSLLRPSGPKVDIAIDLIARLVAQATSDVSVPQVAPAEPLAPRVSETEPQTRAVATATHYWLTPVKSDEEETAKEVIATLVGNEKIYAFGERTPGRRNLKPGDWIAFYETEKGVVAHAQVMSAPERKPHPRVRHAEVYPWTFRLNDVRLYFASPVVIDVSKRGALDAFRGRDLEKSWAWFVQATRTITKHDFDLLTRQ